MAKNYQKKQQKNTNSAYTNKVEAPFQPSFQWISDTWSKNKIGILICMVLAVILYAKSVNFDYVLDDKIVITDNKFTQKGISGIKDIFSYESFRGYFGEQKTLLEGDRYRPFSIATFALEHSFFGSNKMISHLINILLYAFSAYLLFVVLRLLFKDRDDEKWWCSIPFIGTLLFIAHPLHIEVVANIKGRDEIITMIGELLCIYYTFKYLSNGLNKNLIYSGLAFLMAILSKEGAITFLAIVPLTVYFFSNSSSGRIIKVTLPVLVGTLIYLIFRFNAIGYFLSPNGQEITDLMNNPFYGMSFSEKFATIFYTLGLYIKLLFFPDVLTHDYYPYQIPKMNWSDMGAWLSLLIYIGLGLLAVWGLKKKNIYAYGIAFYLITLSIVSNLFVSVGTFMNDRFIYHASIGFCIILAYFIHTTLPKLIKQEGKHNWVGLAIVGLFLSGFTYKTFERLPDWKNTVSLNNAAIRISTNSARANLFYGVAIWENKFLKSKDENEKKKILNELYPYFKKAVQIYPKYQSGWQMMAGCAAEIHKFDHNYDTLLPVFENSNKLIKLDFIQQYMGYIVNNEQDKTNLGKLKIFLDGQVNEFKLVNNQEQLQTYGQMLQLVNSRLGL
jgi:protein O-mannosyl-transferase